MHINEIFKMETIIVKTEYLWTVDNKLEILLILLLFF